MSKAIYLSDAQVELLNYLLEVAGERNNPEVAELVAHIANAPDQPKIVLDIEGGAIHCVRSNMPMEVLVLDADTDGGDEDRIAEINGESVYMHHYLLEPVDPGYDGVDVAHVDATLAEYQALPAESDSVDAILETFQGDLDTIKSIYGVRIAALASRAEDKDISEFLDDQVAEVKSAVGSNAANACSDDQDEQEDAISACETWVTDNVSNADMATRIAAVLWLLGYEEGLKQLEAELA